MAEKLDPRQVVTFKKMWDKRFSPFFGVITLMVSAFLFLMPLQAAQAQSPSTLWKARAFEATEKLESLSKRLEKMKGNLWNSPEAKKLKCESVMEFAYASQLHPSLASMVHKTEEGIDYFKIILNAGDNIFDLTYVYKGNTHMATKLMSLPKDWEVIISPKANNIVFIVMPGACSVALNLSNPFFYSVQQALDERGKVLE